MRERQHEMYLRNTHSSGAEEWYCPACGRCLLITWTPKFIRTVLEPGDEFALHSGAKGGLGVGATQVRTALKEKAETPPEDLWLAPWEEWLDEIDFESLWED